MLCLMPVTFVVYYIETAKDQSCPWVGSTRGSVWVGLGRIWQKYGTFWWLHNVQLHTSWVARQFTYWLKLRSNQWNLFDGVWVLACSASDECSQSTFWTPVRQFIAIEIVFLPRDALQARSMLSCSVRPSVRPSVCPSVTFVDHVKTNKLIFEIFLPSGSDTIPVFPHQSGCRYSDGNPPNGGVEC